MTVIVIIPICNTAKTLLTKRYDLSSNGILNKPIGTDAKVENVREKKEPRDAISKGSYYQLTISIYKYHNNRAAQIQNTVQTAVRTKMVRTTSLSSSSICAQNTAKPSHMSSFTTHLMVSHGNSMRADRIAS